MSLSPLVDVSDRGVPVNSAICEVIINLFDFEMTVDVTLIGLATNFKPDVFKQLLNNILALEITITTFDQLNSTHFSVKMYGQDDSIVVSPEQLVARLRSLSTAQKLRLEGEGFLIVNSSSNAPQVPPTNVIPTRPIPTWAVVVIVVLNSVIIVTVLVIILCVVLRRYLR